MRCRLLGHRFRFRAEGPELVWWCERGCGAGARRRYADEDSAWRYARAFDREDADDVGVRAPLIGMLPLRMWRALRGSRERGSGPFER